MSHTKEPWHTGEQDFTGVDILCADELQIASVEIEEDARRIVACVNACAGISTESLEQEGSAVMGWQRTARKLIDATKQRDELLAALEEACVCIGYSSIPEVNLQQMADAGHKTVISLLNFRKLIASAKGGA